MHCVSTKDMYPDLQTALVVRDEMIKLHGEAMLAYRCNLGCERWHLTRWKKYPSARPGAQMRAWNNLTQDEQWRQYNELVTESAERVRGRMEDASRT